MRAEPLFICASLLSSLAGQSIKTLNLTTTSTNRQFYVIFAARGGSATGHAFVLWGTEDGVHRYSTVKAYGLYPENEKDACSSAIRRVRGALVDESTNHGINGITDELIVKVDESYFNLSMKVARSWQCRGEFALLSSDCVEFMRAVGASLYLDMPHRTLVRWTPRAYMRALMDRVGYGVLRLPYAEYKGTLMNGRPMGRGMLVFKDQSRIDATFWGLDHHVGTGWLYLDSEQRYEGAIIDFKASGRGTIAAVRSIDETETSEPVLTGRFENGVLQQVLHRYRQGRRISQRQAVKSPLTYEDFRNMLISCRSNPAPPTESSKSSASYGISAPRPCGTSMTHSAGRGQAPATPPSSN